MSGRPSAIGFGFQPFGYFQFGHADWAEETMWHVLPIHYREDDAKCDFTPPEPLRKLIDAYKPQIQEIVDKYETFPDLWDANKVPLAQLAQLAYNFDIPMSAINTTEETIHTVGDTAVALDLSTLTIDLPAAIEPGSFKLTVDVAGYDAADTAETRDDGDGNLGAGVVLASGGTIDYTTGLMTGVTQPLASESSVVINYLYTIKDENLLRSEVLNAIQFFVNKGLDKGYEIAGAFSGFLVLVTPLWAADCEMDPALQEGGPTEFYPRYDTFSADEVAADTTYSDFYARWPRVLTWSEPCRSSKLKLYFFSLDGLEIEPDDFSVLAEDIVRNVERVRPIHVEIFDYRFDGPGATGGSWTISVATGGATGGSWTIPVIGALSATGGSWTVPVVATPTP